MILTVEKIVPEHTEQHVDGVECDKCHEKYRYDGGMEEVIALEFQHIRFVAGYGSPFGDGNDIEMDICPFCLFEWSKDFCRIIGEVW